MKNNISLRDSVVNYCVKIGADSMLVQGAGGNISWKDKDTLWVKASGTWLADAEAKNIFVPVDYLSIKKSLEIKDFSITPTLLSEHSLRPSIETILHALMPQRVVVHLHAVNLLAILVRDDCEIEINYLLKDISNVAVVDYFKPGKKLAEAVAKKINTNPLINVVFLKNHGVVIGGNSVNEVDLTLQFLFDKLSTKPISKFENSKNINLLVGYESKFTPIDMPELHNLALDHDLFNQLDANWSLYPDHIVFLGPKVCKYSSIQELINDLNAGANLDYIILKNEGVYVSRNISTAKKLQLLCYYNVLIRQKKNARLKVLTNSEISELLNWESEKYRQQLNMTHLQVKL